jgi:hypothetical protein
MALDADPNHTEALLGSIHVDLLQGNFQKAAEELFTIKQLSPSLPPKAAYLNSLLARQLSKNNEFDHLLEAMNDHIAAFDDRSSR